MRAVYEIMWKSIVEPEMPRNTTRNIRFLRWITKAAYTHSEYVILNAFPRQQ